MRGQNDQPVGVHVDESHHNRGFRVRWLRQLSGAVLGLGWRRGRVLFRVVERGLVAMMPVSDDEFLVVHGRGEQPDGGRVADAPDTVQHTVLVCNFAIGGAVALVENFFLARSEERRGGKEGRSRWSPYY